MNWLVTGGCGFIGTSLISSLMKEQDANVRVVDNLSVGSRSDLASVGAFDEIRPTDVRGAPTGLELVVADVRDDETAIIAAQGVDAIVHLAGNTGVQPSIENPRLDCLSNVVGTLNYLEASRLNGVSSFVFASSGGTVIGECDPPVSEALVPHPKAPYGASKAAGEAYCAAYAGTFGVHTVVLRFSNIYGPRSTHKNSVVAKFIRQAMAGKPLHVFGDGDQTRDFLYIDDLVRALLRAATTESHAGEVFHIASGRETSIGNLSQILVKALNNAGLTDVEIASADALPGEIRRNFADVSKARRLLGWESTVELEAGLGRTVAWFLEHSADAA